MRTLWIILKDSLRESFDSRSLQILLFLSGLAVFFCFTISLDEKPLVDVLPERLKTLNRFEMRRGLSSWSSQSGSTDDLVLSEPRLATTADDLPFPPEGTTILTLETEDVHRLDAWITMWEGFKVQRATGVHPGSPDEVPTYDFEDRERFLRERLLDFGYSDVLVRTQREQDPTRYWIAAHAAYPDEVVTPKGVSVLFGLLTLPSSGSSRAESVIRLQSLLADAFVGFIGMFILLSVVSDFVPNMLRRGTIEPLLARPVRRSQLLLCKYLGGLFFALCVVSFTFGGCWLGLSWSTGYWTPGFLFCTFTALAIFASLSSVALLAGALTRSSMVAVFSALTIWFLSSIVGQMYAVGAFENDPAIREGIETLHVVLPNVKELDKLNLVFLSNAYLSEPARERLFAQHFVRPTDWFLVAWSTTAFTLVMILLAVRHVARRDY